MKEAFHLIPKHPDENLSEKKQVELLLEGIQSTDTSIVAAKTRVFKDYRNNLDNAPSILSGLILVNALSSPVGVWKSPFWQAPLCQWS